MTHKTPANRPLLSTFVFAAFVVIPLLAFFLLLLPQPAAAQSPPAGGEPVAPATVQSIYLPLVTQNAGSAAADAGSDQFSAKAINFQNVDGVWRNPRNDNGDFTDPCTEMDNSPDTADENQVRYGRPQGLAEPNCGGFTDRSGFGFDGVNLVTLNPGEVFLLGRFTHYNGQNQPPAVPMDFVDLNIRIDSPLLAESLSLSYTMRLDETPNKGTCRYGATGGILCDDKVDFINNTSRQVLPIDGKLYALEIVGFVPMATDGCLSAATAVDYFITAENRPNDACVFAHLIEPSPSITVTKTTGSQPLAPGDWADFVITVTNNGNVGLSDVIVHDPMTPDCEKQLLEALQPSGGALKTSAVIAFTCTANYVLADFENVATAEGVFAGQLFSASDSALVDVQAPDTATVRVAKYEDVDGSRSYTTGDRPLFGWTMCLKDSAGLEVVGRCQPTGLDGTAMLAANATGDFQVCEVLQSGWTNTDPGGEAPGAAPCKPVTLTKGPLYLGLDLRVNEVYYGTYGVDLVNRSPEGLTWFYDAYKWWGDVSRPMDRWGLTLPSCIDASQIDPEGTTTDYVTSVDDGPGGTGLTRIWWDTPGDIVGNMGTEFKVKFQQLYATGAITAWVTAGGTELVTATGEVAGPICSDIVALGGLKTTLTGRHLEVRKVVIPASDTGTFDLTIDGNILADDIQDGGTTGRQELAPGIHTVTEEAGTGTQMDDYMSIASCIDVLTGIVSPLGASDGALFLEEGADILCTFTSMRKGSITIEKKTDPVVAASWPFTGSLGEFSLSNDSRYTATQLPLGNYTISETLTPGWRLESVSCNDHSAIALDLPNRTASINLKAGEDLVCTFTNSSTTGIITIIKEANPAVTNPWPFTWTHGKFSVASGEQQAFPALVPGVYEFTEPPTPGWKLATLSCTDSFGVSTTGVDLANGTARISLKPGGNVVCIFKNIVDTGAITIVKQVVGEATAPWTFGNTLGANITLPAAGGSQDFLDVPAGTYTVIEETTAGWYVSDLTYTDPDGGTAVDDFAGSASIDLDPGETVVVTYTNSVAKPAIGIQQLASETLVYANTVVTYTFRVTNRGQLPLSSVWVADRLCSVTPLTNGDYNEGDANANGLLDRREEWLFTCSLPIVKETTNRATAHGTSPSGQKVSATARAAVKVITPKLAIAKTANKLAVYRGTLVTYTITVRNTGNGSLTNVLVTDGMDACTLQPIAQGNGDNVLDRKETWVATCSLVLEEDTTNTAIVTATDPKGTTITATASVAVDVVQPMIQIKKEVDKQIVYGGEKLTFTLRVTNIGDQPLYDVRVKDSLPQCTLSARSGDVGNDGKLGVREQWVYTCSLTACQELSSVAAVDGEVGVACNPAPSLCADVINVGAVTAKDRRGRVWTDTDRVFVDVVRPQLTVSKRVDRAVIIAGQMVTFTVGVKNTGDGVLTGIAVVDSLRTRTQPAPECTLIGPVGDDGNRALDMGEEWLYTCATVLTQNAVNTATATGHDALGKELSGTASVAVIVGSSGPCQIKVSGATAGSCSQEVADEAPAEDEGAYQMYLPFTQRQ